MNTTRNALDNLNVLDAERRRALLEPPVSKRCVSGVSRTFSIHKTASWLKVMLFHRAVVRRRKLSHMANGDLSLHVREFMWQVDVENKV